MNNLAIYDDNKQKIVEAGGLPLYVKLLSNEYDESVKKAAAEGLWSMAFKCKDRIKKEPGCLEGGYLSIIQ